MKRPTPTPDFEAEYGISPLAAAHAAAAGWPSRAGKIHTAGAYVAAVRRAQGWAGRPPAWPDPGHDRPFDGPDGRILAALWRAAPAAPRNHERIEAWVAYWDATQPRPDLVGSDYNDAPEYAARAFRLGIPAGLYPLGYAALLPERVGPGTFRRVQAVLALAAQAPLRRADNVRIPRVCTADLRRLAKLPRWVLRTQDIPLEGGRWWGQSTVPTTGRLARVDWAALAGQIREYNARVPVADLLAAHVPYTAWGRLFPQWDGAEETRGQNAAWIADLAALRRAGTTLTADQEVDLSRLWRMSGDGASGDLLLPLLLHLGGGKDIATLRAEGVEAIGLDEDSFGRLVLTLPQGPPDRLALRVRVENATPDPGGTRRVFHLRVPPWVRTAREAVAWTFALPTGEYAPVAQS